MARSIELITHERRTLTSANSPILARRVSISAKRRHYDIIILDRQLPDLSGSRSANGTQGRQGGQTHVLILSGNAIVETKVKALGFGADDYLTKPLAQG